MDSNIISSALNRHSAPSDSRLLNNLIKAERNYITHLHASVKAAQTASASLTAWGTSEATDIADTSARLSNLLAASADVQSTHVAAIEGYRAALKDVADREASIRTVVRDRDILVGRLVKASQKSASTSSKKSPEERAEKLAKAQRELSSCEQVLLSEEAALVGVKRRTFKEALTMRMKTMGDAGAAMVDAAKEAILLLNDFDSTAGHLPYSPMYEDFDGGDIDTSQQQDMHPYAHYRPDDNMNQFDDQYHAMDHHYLENSSVTPSQSASQVYQPRTNRESQLYNAPFGEIAETDREQHGYNNAAQQQQQQQQPHRHEADSDDEDWQHAFSANNNVNQPAASSPLPAPHQLDRRAGTEADFVPHGMPQTHLPPPLQHTAPQQQNYHAAQNLDNASTPAPALPDKDIHHKRLTNDLNVKKPQDLLQRTPSKRKTENAPKRQLNYVPMPPVPSAPRMDANGVTMPSIPSAPKLYMPRASGAQDDSSSDEEGTGGNTISHRGGGSTWGSSAAQRRGDGDNDSSNDGTARADSHVNGAARKGGFFGKMGRFFKSDEKERQAQSPPAQEARQRRTSLQWDTRTNSNLRRSNSVRDPSSLHRRSKVLSGPLVPQEPDSSDDERVDDRNLVRHVNKGPPLWQTPLKTSSDLGAGPKLASRPSTLKRTPSASVTAGPLSWKAQQAATQEVNPEEKFTPSAPTTVATPAKKTKKKKGDVRSNASVDGGSEIGTQSTRTKHSTLATPTAPQRNSVVVHGDASSGIRRSDSLNYGSMRGGNDRLAKRASKRMSAMSVQQVHGYGTKGGSSITPADPSGKFATSNWVAKSNAEDSGAMNEAAQTSSAPVIAKPKAVKPATSTGNKHISSEPKKDAVASQQPKQRDQSDEPPKHVPQPSRTMSPPLKPALKYGSNDLSRSGSLKGMANIPTLPDPIAAPPRASAILEGQNFSSFFNQSPQKTGDKTLTEQGRLGQTSNFDGTGSLNMPASYENGAQSGQRQDAAPTPRTALPRIDMPPAEPFKVDLEANKKIPSTPQNEGARQTYDSSPLLTPNEREAYNKLFSQHHAGESEGGGAKDQSLQPEGITRTTVARASVGSGVLGPKNVPPPAASSPAVPAAQASVKQNDAETNGDEALERPGKLSRSYSGEAALSSDSSDDEGAVESTPAQRQQANALSASAAGGSHAQAPAQESTVVPEAPPKKPASILSGTHLPVSRADGAQRSPDGSSVSRRKSVRMAPDVKLPPETPPGDVYGSGGGQFYSAQQRHTSANNTSQLSSRIAPPPPAPARVTAHMDRPIDLDNMRDRSAWSTRIGMSRTDDSSDEEDAGAGADSYASARRNFGSISRSWGKATGQSARQHDQQQQNPQSQPARGGGEETTKKPKKTKKSATSNSGYNPAIPLPAGMQVVGRSASKRGN